MTNELTKDIALADGKACYDAYYKRILANKSILTWILKFTVSEFAEMTFSQIRNCIDADPEISSERIEPGYTNSRITDYVSGIPDRVKGYDKLSVIIICLNETSENQSQLTAMLNTLLSSRLPVKEKIQNLENKFQIKVNNDLGKELNQMCNLSDLVEERGMEKGKSLMIITMIQKKCQKNKTLEETAAELEENADEIRDIYWLVRKYPEESSESIFRRWRGEN